MNPISKLTTAAALVALVGQAASGQVYSRTPNARINDFQTASSAITVAGGPTSITDLNIVFRAAHSWDGDLEVVVQGPTGYLCLTTDNGGFADNFITTRFDDSARDSITSGNAPFDGNFRPETTLNEWNGTPTTFPGSFFPTLSGFHGTNANGTWTIYVSDDSGGDTGTFQYWSLEFNGALDPAGPPPTSQPTNPVLAATITPTRIYAGESFRVLATFTPGTNPPSSGVRIFAATDFELFDDGTSDDGIAGNNIFGGTRTLAGNPAPGSYAFEVTATDAQNRAASTTLPYTVFQRVQWEELANGRTDSGDLPTSAQQIVGAIGPVTAIGGELALSDVDMFEINICDPASFSANLDDPRTTVDTQVWLFNAGGFGVEFNDDTPTSSRSFIDSSFVTTPGRYYLAISAYNRDPLDFEGSTLWRNDPFVGIREPDSGGGGNPVASWSQAVTPPGTYVANLTGVCIQIAAPTCDPDLSQDGNADQGDIDYLVNVIAGGFNPTGIDPDFNRDGNSDQGDLDALVNVIAGGLCP